MEANGATSASAGFTHLFVGQDAVKLGPANAEDFGGFDFVAADGVENVANVFALHLFQTDERYGRIAGWRYGIEAEVFGVEHAAFAHHAGIGDGVFQFADVSRPAIFGKHVRCATTDAGDLF